MARWFGWLGVLRPRVLGADHRAGLNVAERALAGRGPRCPACRTGRLGERPGDPTLRVCGNAACGAPVPLEALAEAALAVGADRAVLAEQHRREATRLTISAQAGTIAASLWAVYSGSWATLWGGAAIAVVLLAMAVVARYRAWQVEHGRMFETQAPFGEFLAFEAAGLLGRGA